MWEKSSYFNKGSWRKFFLLAPMLYSVTFVTRNSPLIAHCNLTQPEEPVGGETEGARWTDTRDDWTKMQGILNDLKDYFWWMGSPHSL